MEYGTGKGTLLGEFESCRFKKKRNATLYRGMAYLVFLDIPMSILSLSKRFPDWNNEPVLVGTLIAVFIIDVIAIILGNHFSSQFLTPIRIYSQGIEKRRTLWDRITKKDGFYSQDSIEYVQLRTYDRMNFRNRPVGKELFMTIHLKNGKWVSLGDRGFNNAARIKDLLTNGAKITVESEEGFGQNAPAMPKASVNSHSARKIPVPVAAPVQSSNKFCIHCGAKIENGSKFCGYCGGKQE